MDRDSTCRSALKLPDRVVLVDKPVGPTSFDMVRRVRRGTRGRAGHSGTLDPFASGLLLVMTGRATRLSSLLMGLPKEYELTVQFGAESSTGDPTGTISTRGGTVEAGQVAAALDRFRGPIIQRVPLTSAVKMGGEALYKKAHRGESAETPEREVTVYDLALAGFDRESQQALVIALVSSGTYLRVLAADLGARLGVGGFAARLRRTRIGPFAVTDAVDGDTLCPERLGRPGRGVLTMDEGLCFLPKRTLDERRSRLAANGNRIDVPSDGRFRACSGERLLGVFEGRGGVARPLVVFPEME